MLARSHLDAILNDELLTRQLGDPEARVLIEWLVEQAEGLDGKVGSPVLESEIHHLCRRGRIFAQLVRLWAIDRRSSAAHQLAASERIEVDWPAGPVEPVWLMQRLVSWETTRRVLAAPCESQ
jgi:hypothetical protein